MTDQSVTSYSNPSPPAPSPLAPVGIGLRFKHMDEMCESAQNIGWVEVHPENYFGGGKPTDQLRTAREHYPLSLHAVGLSLGSTDEVSRDHLAQIKVLVDEFQPFLVSDHASWSMSGNAHLNDLMPLPYTVESLAAMCRNINMTQDFLGRQILVENPSSYIAYNHNDMSEAQFLNEAVRETGCGILLDVNNVYVQSHNHDFDPYDYINEIDLSKIGEMHLAGHTERTYEQHGTSILIDTHSKHVRDEVWKLFDYTAAKAPLTPTLIEWDDDIPDLSVLLEEARKADEIIKAHHPVPQEGLQCA